MTGCRMPIIRLINQDKVIISNSVRSGGRVVDRASLENWYRGNSIEGSNPTLSANESLLFVFNYLNMFFTRQIGAISRRIFISNDRENCFSALPSPISQRAIFQLEFKFQNEKYYIRARIFLFLTARSSRR